MQPKRTARHHKYETDADLPPGLRTLQIGAWRVVYLDKRKNWSKLASNLFAEFDLKLKLPSRFMAPLKNIGESYIVRYLQDVYCAAPRLVVWYLFIGVVMSLQPALELQTSSRLLQAIEGVLRGGERDTPSQKNVLIAIVMRLLVVNVGALGFWVSTNIMPLLTERINTTFKSRLIEAHLGLDTLSAQDRINALGNFSPTVASEAFQGFVRLASSIISSISQLSVVANILWKQEGGMVIVFLAILSPIFSWANTQVLWEMLAILYVNNPWTLRARAMFHLATIPEYHEEIASYGLGRYISSEYREATRRSPLSYEDDPYNAFNPHRSPLTDMVKSMLGDLPLIYFALCTIADPKSFSLSTLVLLTQMSQTMGTVFSTLVYQNSELSHNVHGVKKLYAGMDLKPRSECEAGEVPYPPPLDDSEKKSKNVGMHIELRNVSFQYPGTQDTQARMVLQDVSFTLPSSSLVVIVGENGSGKTTLVKLLTGLFRPTSGDILINGVDIKKYKAEDLTRASALLTQNHNIFPMTIAENIGVGDTSSVDDLDRVKEAAELGGAKSFIESLPDGYETVLKPVETAWSTRYLTVEVDALKEVMDEVERSKDVSGGEKQRLAAARTFMRFSSGNIRLVVVDEPTSAMDPAGEYELFQKLRLMREGKTMVFVTHRFGHLTKHADLILCMKDGKLVETGTHRELVQKSGEYHKLYDIQARAFVDTPDADKNVAVEE
ncbi:P-loop containing nucleoside triphosphate hydrolase protein [Irpex rosettiformis]|uniref:P-loop containing nucleoside triphosphate hydrolase protein n=1 Tax=Irpex rosettiformis TaxID=378272 RepID=A0ACB8TY82_9APHY|nr:P-loop containing nucleoside triphosphate hydrolase protein [Irpex rosettiformis]